MSRSDPPKHVIEEFNRLYDSIHFDVAPMVAIDISRTVLAFAEQLEWELGTARGHAILAVSLASVGLVDEASLHYEVAIPALEFLDFTKSLIVKNNYANMISNTAPLRALPMHRSVVRSATDANLPFALCCGLIGLGNDYDKIGDTVKFIDYNLQALKTANEQHIEGIISTVRINLAEALAKQGDFESALEQAREALAIEVASGHLREVPVFKTVLSSIYCKMGQPREAERVARESIEETRAIQMWDNIETLQMLGEALAAQGNITGAMEWFGRALEINRTYEGGSPTFGRNILLSMARCIMGNDPTHALGILNEVLEAAQTSGEQQNEAEAHTLISDCLAAIGKDAEALQHFKIYYELRSQLFTEQSNRQLLAFRVEQEMEKHEEEARGLRTQKDQLQRELGNSTLQLVAQTELLTELRNDLLKFVRKFPMPDGAAKELRERLKTLPCKSVDWERFDTQFKAAHPELIKRLMERHATLSPTELRICTLLRMNLRSAEIARLFCLSERTVEDHRANIRKKLKMKRSEDLITYLTTL
jgi:tetratricopeptide (TPR) repeat protein/DNA-binding CsgD family transcriptional regulator